MLFFPIEGLWQLTRDGAVVDLADGRSVPVPLGWYPRLLHASGEERGRFRLIGSGEGVHWERLDEDISVEGIVAGRRSMESTEPLRRWLQARKARDDLAVHLSWKLHDAPRAGYFVPYTVAPRVDTVAVPDLEPVSNAFCRPFSKSNPAGRAFVREGVPA